MFGVHKKLAPQVGFEPTTCRLTAECSTAELLRNVASNYNNFLIFQLTFFISILKIIFNDIRVYLDIMYTLKKLFHLVYQYAKLIHLPDTVMAVLELLKKKRYGKTKIRQMNGK